MPTLYDGTRSFNAIKGATAWPSQPNKLQDDLILGLEERVIAIPIQLAYHDPAETSWRYIEADAANPPYWYDPSVTNGDILLLPLPYMMGATQITELAIVVAGSAAATGGGISLWEQPIDAVPTAVGVPAAGAVDLDITDPWQPAAVRLITTGAINFDIVPAAAYYLACTSATSGGGANPKVYSAYMTALFHKGT